MRKTEFKCSTCGNIIDMTHERVLCMPVPLKEWICGMCGHATFHITG